MDELSRINQRKIEQLTRLNELSRSVVRVLDLDKVLTEIVDKATAMLNVETGSVLLLDDKDEPTGELYFATSVSEGKRIEISTRLQPNQGFAGWVIATGQPIYANEVDQDPRWFGEVETGFNTHSLLCVPLELDGRAQGVLQVLNSKEPAGFNEEHVALLSAFAATATIAIENARLYKQAQEADQQRRRAAETLSAMAAIILNKAHDMNNIIGSIRMSVLRLQKTYAADTKLLHKLNDIQQRAEDATALFAEIRSQARLRRVSLAATDARACLERAIQSCWWPANITLSKRYEPDLPPVRANDQHLESIFYNLLVNAIQVLETSGGEIRLSARYARPNWVEIAVSDNGPGIPPHIQNDLFDPEVSGRAEGLGLGLWLAQIFVHQFGGEIEFSSSPDRGTTFRVWLPVWP